MPVNILTREEFRKKYGRRGTTISTISPEEFGRRTEAYWHKVKAERLAKAEAEAKAKAQATPSPTEK